MNRDSLVARGKAYAPVWLASGLFLGCLFGWLAFRSPPEAPAGPAAKSVPALKAVITAGAGNLALIEGLFWTWGGYAVWEDDMTEFVALTKQPGRIQAEYYQVIRAHRRFYFRTLQHLTRPLIDHGELARCPLAFTETAEMREMYYLEHPDETPGRYSIEELMGRAPLLPPRPPVTAETAAESMSRTMPSAGIPVPPSTKPDQPFQQPKTTPGDGVSG